MMKLSALISVYTKRRLNMRKQKKEGAMALSEKVGFGFGPVGKNMASSLVYGSFLSLYFMQVLDISPAFLSVMFLLCRVWDGLNDLFMGAIIDAVHSRFGKFKPWIVIGAVTNAACTILIYFDPGFRGAGIYIWATVLYVLCDMTYTMIDVSYWALVPAMTFDRNERDQLAVIPRITGAVGGVVSSFTLNIVDKLGGRGSNAGFIKYALIASVVYIATSVLCAAKVKERAVSVNVSQERFSLKKAAKVLFGNDQALTVVIIMTLFNTANCITTGILMYYFMYVLNNDSIYGFVGIATGAIQGIGTLGFPLLAKKINRNKAYVIAYIVPIIGYAIMAAVGSISNINPVIFIVACVPPFLGYGAMSVMQTVMLADAVDYGEWKTGERNEGTIFSMLTFLSKIANGLSQAIIFGVFALVKFDADAEMLPTPAALTSFKLLLFAFPVVFLIGAAIVHKAKFSLKPELVDKISGELSERRENKAAE